MKPSAQQRWVPPLDSPAQATRALAPTAASGAPGTGQPGGAGAEQAAGGDVTSLYENRKEWVDSSGAGDRATGRPRTADRIRYWHGAGSRGGLGVQKSILWIALAALVLYVVVDMLGFGKLWLPAIAGLLSGLSRDMPVGAQDIELAPFKFHPLLLGSIKPKGWLESQLQLMANGLAGHEHDFYRYVVESPWLGGNQEYSQLHEGFPYWLNGIVPLAYSIDDERLKQQIKTSVEYVLDHQAEDGWLGPETVESGTRNIWGRFPLLLAFTQLVEADSDYADTVLPATRKYLDLVHEMLSNNGTGFLEQPGDVISGEDHGWARIRAADFILSLQWLYENDNNADQEQLLEIMGMVRRDSLDWADWYNDEHYIKGDLNFVDEDYLKEWFPFEHGVNVGQGLKAGAVINRFEHNETMITIARRAVDWTFTYHGNPSGSILADERLEGLIPYSGSELCTTVETMYSLSYLYQAIGDKDFADRAELAAFNALPAAVLGNWWAHQYVSVPNQPFAKILDKPLPFWNVNDRGTIFGLEPNYPCCTVNHPQGYPKFVSNSWVTVGSDGLGHALLSPSAVETTLDNGAEVTVEAITNYPFSDVISYDISSSEDFTLWVRIPSWSKSAFWSYSNEDGDSKLSSANADSSTGLLPIRVSAGESQARVSLRRTIETVERGNNSVSVYHGPLLYILDVGYEVINFAAEYFWANATNRTDIAGEIPAEARDWEITNSLPWNIAIDTSTLVAKVHRDTDVNSQSLILDDEIWSPGAPPIYLEAEGCEIEWNTFGELPGPVPTERKCIGERRTVRLVPHGSAKIGMAELPTL